MKAADSSAPSIELLRTIAGTSPSASAPKEAAQAWQREMERAQADAWFRGALPHFSAARTVAEEHASGTPRAAVEKTSSNQHEGRAAAGSHAASSTAVQVEADEATGSHARRVIGRSEAQQSASHLVHGSRLAGTEGRRPLANEVVRSVQAAPAAPADAHALAPTTTPLLGTALRSSALTVTTGSVLVLDTACDDSAASCETQKERGVGRPRPSTPERAGEQQPMRIHIEYGPAGPTVWLGVDSAAVAQVPALTQAMARWMAAAGYTSPTWICNGQPWRPAPAVERGGADEYASMRPESYPIPEPGIDHPTIHSLNHTGTPT